MRSAPDAEAMPNVEHICTLRQSAPPGTRRIRLTLEYDGTNYAGWQRQINAMTVQQRLEEAIFKLTGERATTTGSSRTDSGVHALGQTVHFDLATRIPAEKVSFALNAKLPPDIRVRESSEAAPDFHARYDAASKVYRYLIYNARHANAVRRTECHHVSLPLDERAMNAEAQLMAGTHDFAAFAASGSIVKDTVRTMYRAEVRRQGDYVMLIVHGGGFLYNMVRILAGTLIGVGADKLPSGAITRAIASGDRLCLGATAPAQGLTLLRVFYGDDERAASYFSDESFIL